MERRCRNVGPGAVADRTGVKAVWSEDRRIGEHTGCGCPLIGLDDTEAIGHTGVGGVESFRSGSKKIAQRWKQSRDGAEISDAAQHH